MKRRLFILLIPVFLFTSEITAQVYNQKAVIHFRAIGIWDMIHLRDNTLMALTYSPVFSPAAEILNFTVIKLTMDLDTIWSKTYFNNSVTGYGYRILQDADDNIIVIGFTDDTFVCKIDLSGNLLWTKTYGAAYYEGSLSAIAFPGGGSIVTGYVNGPLSLAGDYMVRLDTSGDTIWTTFMDSASLGYMSVALDQNNNIYSCGYGNINNANCLLATSFTDSGQFRWRKKFQAGPQCGGISLTILSDSTMLLCGYARLTLNDNILLIKTDLNGSLIWSKVITNIGNESAATVYPTPDGGFLIAGSHQVGTDVKALIISMDSAGTVKWAKSYGAGPSSAFNDVLLINDNIYAAGYTDSNGYGYLIKADSTGYSGCNEMSVALQSFNQPVIELTDTPFVYSHGVTGTISLSDSAGLGVYPLCAVGVEENELYDIRIYPNPSDGVFNLFTDGYDSNQITVFDITGRTILEKEFVSETRIDLTNNASGLYLLQVKSEGQQFNTKLIVR